MAEYNASVHSFAAWWGATPVFGTECFPEVGCIHSGVHPRLSATVQCVCAFLCSVVGCTRSI